MKFALLLSMTFLYAPLSYGKFPDFIHGYDSASIESGDSKGGVLSDEENAIRIAEAQREEAERLNNEFKESLRNTLTGPEEQPLVSRVEPVLGKPAPVEQPPVPQVLPAAPENAPVGSAGSPPRFGRRATKQ